MATLYDQEVGADMRDRQTREASRAEGSVRSTAGAKVGALALGALLGCGDASELTLDPEGELTQWLLESNGLPSNGLPSNGLGANGLVANGLSANGMAANGLSSNGLPSNGLSSNGLSANGLPSNGLSSNGLTFSNWFHWFQGCGTADGCDPNNGTLGSTGMGTAASRVQAATIMRYIVQCACPAGTTRGYTDRAGTTWSWAGNIGIATDWCQGAPATVAEQEWVSACLMALVNRNGPNQGSMQISLLTSSPERTTLNPVVGSLEDGIYRRSSNVYYGNFFGDASVGKKGRFAAPRFESTYWGSVHGIGTGRDCALDGCGVMSVLGQATDDLYLTDTPPFPDWHGHDWPDNGMCESWLTYCSDDQSRTWSRVLSVRLSMYQRPREQIATAAFPIISTSYAETPDANGELGSSERWGWVGKIKAGEYWTTRLRDSTTRPAGTVKVRFRYKSSAAGTFKIRTGLSSSSTTLPSTNNSNWSKWVTFTLPASGNLWTYSDGASMPQTAQTTSDWRFYQVISADSAATKVELDGLFEAI